MTMRDEDFAAPARLDEADGEFWSPPMAAPAPKPGKVTTGALRQEIDFLTRENA